MVELESLISQMVWQSVGIQAWVGELQTGWRIFFAWLLQRLHASDSIDTSKLPRPANTESVMRILTHWHSGVVSGNIFAVEVHNHPPRQQSACFLGSSILLFWLI